MKQILLFSLLFVNAYSFSQVGIGTTTPNASAELDVTSTTKGFLPPRMTTTERNNIVSPTTGLQIYNISTNTNDFWNGDIWQSNLSPITGVLPIGNGGTGLSTIGTNGQVLTSNGTIANWATPTGGGGGASTIAAVQTANFTALPNFQYPVNTTSGSITLTLPASPIIGQTVSILDYARTFGTNNLTINPNGSRLANQVNNYVLNTNGTNVELKYIDNVQGWIASDFFTWNPTLGPIVGDALIQSILSTNLSAFNAASAGTAVPITQTEWDALNVVLATGGGGKSGCTNTQLTTTLNSSNAFQFGGDYTDFFPVNLTITPANRRVYGFAHSLRTTGVDGIGRIKSFYNDVGVDLHTNNIPITFNSAPLYYVIKTPPGVSANSQEVGSYVSVGHFKFNTGSLGGYKYLSGNVNTGTWNNANTAGIPLIQFAYGCN
jgi:hypothetical protein